MPAEPDGAALIADERQQQLDREGWTSAHDDEHDAGEILHAAHCYMDFVRDGSRITGVPVPPFWWPWERAAWKPTGDPVRNLVKAGALIAAEIDRLQRSATPDESS